MIWAPTEVLIHGTIFIFANGKARIFNLDVPSAVWMGQTPNLKADGASKINYINKYI